MNYRFLFIISIADPSPTSMKCLFTSVTLALVVFCHSLQAQSEKVLEPGYYVVVAAYSVSKEDLAQKYVDVLSRQGYNAAYGYNPFSKLLLVHIHYSDNLREGLQEMYRTRNAGKFTDAWVRVMPGVVTLKGEAQTTPKPTDGDKVTNEDSVDSRISQTPASKDTLNANEGVEQPDSLQTEVTDNEPIKQYPHMTLGNTEVFLSLYHAQNNQIVDGDVQVIDTDRSKFLTKVKGNEYLLLPDPKSQSGKLTLICEAFGFRRMQEEITYPVPLADTMKPHIDLMGTTIVVNFDLVRYYKGDKAVMYNVYFYNDAAIMLPESQYELNSLVQMMKEIPGYRIMLHGHTNGNYQGTIISMNDEENFFSLDRSVRTVGTAKDLSRNRAEAIKKYLVKNGISGDRVEIKAWGGKRPLYDKHGVNAKKNVRVEVEILNR